MVAFKYNEINNVWYLLWHSTLKDGITLFTISSSENKWTGPTITELDKESPWPTFRHDEKNTGNAGFK